MNKDSKATKELTLPPGTIIVTLPPDTKVNTTAKERAEKLSKTRREGKDFTKAGKKAVKQVNKEKNNGQMTCENCGTDVNNASKHTKNVTPPSNEAHVDHIVPKAKGGSGTPDNGQVLCRSCNLEKAAN